MPGSQDAHATEDKTYPCMKTYLLLLLVTIGPATHHAFGQAAAKRPATSNGKSATASVTAKSETLTNKNVLELHRAGLEREVILAKIDHSVCKFDVSTAALVELKKAGLDADIIKAMIDRGNENTGSAPKRAVGKSDPSAPDIGLVNHPYHYNGAKNSVNPLEKGIASTKTKSKVLGYGGTSFVYEVAGEKSETRIPGTDSIAFLINTGGDAPPELVLYKLKRGSKARTAVSAQFKVMGGMKSGDNVISYTITRAGEGLYKITPAQALAAGEYFFAGKPVASATTVDVYAFGVD